MIETGDYIPLYLRSRNIKNTILDLSNKCRSFRYTLYFIASNFRFRHRRRNQIRHKSYEIASLIDIHNENCDTYITILGDQKYQLL